MNTTILTPSTAILMPMLGMIGLTFFTLWYMYFSRVNYMRTNKIDPQRLQDRNSAKQALLPVAAPADHFNNLLELPLLFYLAVILIWLLNITDYYYLGMAWLFVLLRLMHSAIHLTYNRVMHRFIAFCTSSFVLMLIWLRISLRLLGQ